VAVVGTGRVGSTLGPRLAALGYEVVYGSRNPGSPTLAELLAKTGHGARAVSPEEATAEAELIILAVPYAAVEELLLSFGNLSGKVIIDCINAVRFRRQEISLAIPSMAETIARLAPGAHVVKALNTTSTTYMVEPDHPQGTVSMPIAGDDPAAKGKVTALVEALGFHAVDVGPLSNAAYLEAMGALYIHMNAIQGRRGNFEYRILERD
jgi:predicted dinucleotide-binding enzyme